MAGQNLFHEPPTETPHLLEPNTAAGRLTIRHGTQLNSKAQTIDGSDNIIPKLLPYLSDHPRDIEQVVPGAGQRRSDDPT